MAEVIGTNANSGATLRALTWSILLIVLLAGATAVADQVRLSVVFTHYSVGGQIVKARCNIRDDFLDTMRVIVGNDTAGIVFRDYFVLDEELHDTASAACGDIDLSGPSYDLAQRYNRTIIWSSNDGTNFQNSGLLKYFFNVSDRETQDFWQLVSTHDVPLAGGGTVQEKYDLIIIKNPYVMWSGAVVSTPGQIDSMKASFEAARDTLVNHPDINLAFAFGTPLYLGRYGVDDSSTAKITYDLAQWFDSDSFFSHSNTGAYKNIWKWNSYTPLCETGALPNRYCLKSEYFDGASTGSHLSEAGAELSQEGLAALIRRVASDILLQRSGTVTRQDIDLKIRDFRDGAATLEEVLQLIEQYNTSTGG